MTQGRGMFCVIYKWNVKPGREDEFRDTWRVITEAIFKQHGSLGSRMHSNEDGSWIAYAQWPTRDLWENHSDTLGMELTRLKQKECLLEDVQVLMKLTMTDDLLRDSLTPTLRVARPTNNMEAVIRFYRDGLGLKELGHFENHDGFDGVMLGERNAPYHLEFTHCHGHSNLSAPTQDNLLIFYKPDEEQWQSSVSRMKSFGYQPVPSFNPYWDRKGQTFEDPDGYRVVLQNGSWTV